MLPIFVINLDRSPDRLEHMAAEFRRVGLGFERFSAVDGKALPQNVRSYFVQSQLSPGELGCYASHICLWQRVATQSGPVLICEDDLILPDDLSAVFSAVLDTAPEGWDIVRLSSKQDRRIIPFGRLVGNRMLVRYLRSPVHSGAYLITPGGASKLLAPVPRTSAVDRDIARPWRFGLSEFGVSPNPIKQNVGDSIIASARAPRSMMERNSDRWHRIAFNIQTFGLMQCLRSVSAHTPPTCAPHRLRAPYVHQS